MEDKTIVSISCTAYNHENYIEDAMEGFLMQKTNFRYEILIHDDASTDKTADIIRKYEKKHPECIFPIYQKQNQYSKGLKVGRFNRERAKGKYIALCEGDDYWIDPLKLQKQVDYMEKHPECSMCFHAAYKVNEDKRKMRRHIRPAKRDKEFSVDEILIGGGGLFSTNSVLYLSDKGRERPEFYYNAPIGDYPMAIFMALQGKVFYMDEFMSSYRVGNEKSWTKRMTYDLKQAEKHYSRLETMLDEINSYTEYKYNSAIKKVKIKTNLKKTFPNLTKILKIIRNMTG